MSLPKYLIKRIDKVGIKPIQSIGTYVSLDAECIIAGSTDKTLRFLDAETLDEIAKCRVDKKSVNFVAISDMGPEGDDPLIITGGKDKTVQIWNSVDGSLEQNIELPTNEVRSLAIYQGSETYLVVGTKDAKVIVWDLLTNSLVTTFKGHKASVHCVTCVSYASDPETQYDMDYLLIASGGADRTARTWDIVTGKKKKKFRHKRSISTMVVANKGIRPILATAGVERVIKLWDVETGVLLRSLDGHLDQINSLVLWEGFEMLLISGSSDRTIRVYDILSGECVCILHGHTDAVLDVSIADYDDPKIVSSSDDLSLMQWSLFDIIEEFFHTDEDKLGFRNDTPAYLPEIVYEAPDELDKNLISKADRKRIRKQIKRNKRLSQMGIKLEVDKKNLGFDSDDDDFDEDEDYDDDFDEYDDNDEYVKVDELQGAEGSGSNKVLPEGAEPVRRASVQAVKNVLSSVLGIGSKSSSVGIAPHKETEEEEETFNAEQIAQEAKDNANKLAAYREKKKAAAHEKNLRTLANETHAKFHIAAVEQELEITRKKEAASSKLQARLAAKKRQAAGEVEQEKDEAARAEEEMQQAKKEKLLQHKAQEKRRQASMIASKDRSGIALKKRLEEVAKKQKAKQAEGGGGGGGGGEGVATNQAASGKMAAPVMGGFDEGDEEDDEEDGDGNGNGQSETKKTVSAMATTISPGGTKRSSLVELSDEDDDDDEEEQES